MIIGEIKKFLVKDGISKCSEAQGNVRENPLGQEKHRGNLGPEPVSQR
jgi:hypothetical protein